MRAFLLSLSECLSFTLMILRLKNSEPGLNLTIMMSRCQLKCMQTAEILKYGI